MSITKLLRHFPTSFPQQKEIVWNVRRLTRSTLSQSTKSSSLSTTRWNLRPSSNAFYTTLVTVSGINNARI